MKNTEPDARQHSGARLAALLARSWREPPPPPEISEAQLEALTQVLIRSGAAGLAWRRIRASELARSAAARELEDAYRGLVLHAALRERTLAAAAARLNAIGIRPIVVKGWAIARTYPEPGLRPYYDIDLCVPPAQYGLARAALPPEAFRGVIDLHDGFHNGWHEFDPAHSAEMAERAVPAKFGGSDIQVLSPEDHFRLLCFHLLRHGAWRPVWLCDVALALESRSSDFDWSYCLGADDREADWIACTIGLAGHLLGAGTDDTPVAARAKNLPRWLVPAVLNRWVSPPRAFRHPLGRFFASPAALLREIGQRIADPLTATISLNGPLNNAPRLPFQVADAAWRAAKVCVNLPEHLSAQRRARAAREER